MTTLNLVIAGAGGRMGRVLIEALLQDPKAQLTGALDMPGSLAVGQDATAFLGRHSGITIGASLEQGLQGAHCLIDFTRPEGSMAHLRACRQRGVAMVIGTTGFSTAQKAEIAEAAHDIPLVMSPNMSLGVNLCLKLLQMAAQTLPTGYDIEIIEAHHRHKVDAPSGTALQMGEVIAQAQGFELKDRATFGRQGHTGERAPDSIGFSAIRGGDIVGDHTVMFAGSGERIEISHKASSRDSYAQGSLRAAHFLVGRKKGLYDMFDVLGLRQQAPPK